jgi:hypothetical protein
VRVWGCNSPPRTLHLASPATRAVVGRGMKETPRGTSAPTPTQARRFGIFLAAPPNVTLQPTCGEPYFRAAAASAHRRMRLNLGVRRRGPRAAAGAGARFSRLLSRDRFLLPHRCGSRAAAHPVGSAAGAGASLVLPMQLRLLLR